MGAALADLRQPRVVFQPIIDLVRGVVVGYEALSRFELEPRAGPDAWFAAAARAGVGAELEARALACALAARPRLPPDTFLSCNIDPNVLGSGPLDAVLAGAGHLGGVVLELTEHTVVSDYGAIAEPVRAARRAGAMFAVDDAGAGYASLSHIVALRPDFVKLDRSIVADLDRDEVKRALTELLGQFAGRADAWLLAEGVERVGELDALTALGVPLGQGYLLGRPGPEWVGLDPAVSTAIARSRPPVDRHGPRVVVVLERAPALPLDRRADAAALFRADPGLDLVVLLDRWSRPRAWQGRDGVVREGLQLVKAISPLADVARRAMTRPAGARFHPLVVTDEAGAYVGLARMERVLERLAAAVAAPPPADRTAPAG